jgi:predicted transcriptional regulator
MIPCEIAVKSVIPAIRAYVAKELILKYKLKQADVALPLGITQTAVSKYLRHVRGQAIRIDHVKEIRDKLDETASKIADKKIPQPQLALMFCEICRSVRQNAIMCELCKRTDPTLDITLCSVCKDGKACTP